MIYTCDQKPLMDLENNGILVFALSRSGTLLFFSKLLNSHKKTSSNRTQEVLAKCHFCNIINFFFTLFKLTECNYAVDFCTKQNQYRTSLNFN